MHIVPNNLPTPRRNVKYSPHINISYAGIIREQHILHALLYHTRLLDRVVFAGYDSINDSGRSFNQCLNTFYMAIKSIRNKSHLQDFHPLKFVDHLSLYLSQCEELFRQFLLPKNYIRSKKMVYNLVICHE